MKKHSSRIVLYKKGKPDDEAVGSVFIAYLRVRPDAVIVVGTSTEISSVLDLHGLSIVIGMTSVWSSYSERPFWSWSNHQRRDHCW